MNRVIFSSFYSCNSIAIAIVNAYTKIFIAIRIIIIYKTVI